jgi:hypothetical protein
VLRGLFEDLQLQLAEAPGCLYGDAQRLAQRRCRIPLRQLLRTEIRVVFEDGLEKRQAPERL